MRRKRGYKRGYPVALLVGFEDDHAVLWQVFSHIVKQHLTLKLQGRRMDELALYNFHESVLGALRPMFNEGTRSVVVTSQKNTTYAADFLAHVRKHHKYLLNSKISGKVAFASLVGSADNSHLVSELVGTKEFRKIIARTTSSEADDLVSILEKHLYSGNNESVVLYSLKEIEDKVYDKGKPEDLSPDYLILTDKYLAETEDKNRVNRLLQIAENRKVKTRIIKDETPAGKRISQFGGIVFLQIQDK